MLLRLVIAEAVLLGLVSIALGFAAGMLMSFDAHRLWVITIGYAPNFAVPWWIVGIGAGVIMLVAVAASIAPAMSVGARNHCHCSKPDEPLQSAPVLTERPRLQS